MEIMPPTIPTKLQGVWRLDTAHSEISFTVRHMMTKVRGDFTTFSGTIQLAADPLASHAEAEIQMASVNTRNEMRDGHLRSSEILDIEHYPTMRFSSTKVRSTSGTEFELDGALTIRDVTRPVTLHVVYLGSGVDPTGTERIGFSATTAMSRKDFGVEFNVPLSGDKLLLSDEVAIALELQATRVG